MIVRNLLATPPQIPDDSAWSKITWSTQPGQEQPEPLEQIAGENPYGDSLNAVLRNWTSEGRAVHSPLRTLGVPRGYK